MKNKFFFKLKILNYNGRCCFIGSNELKSHVFRSYWLEITAGSLIPSYLTFFLRPSLAGYNFLVRFDAIALFESSTRPWCNWSTIQSSKLFPLSLKYRLTKFHNHNHWNPNEVVIWALVVQVSNKRPNVCNQFSCCRIDISWGKFKISNSVRNVLLVTMAWKKYFQLLFVNLRTFCFGVQLLQINKERLIRNRTKGFFGHKKVKWLKARMVFYWDAWYHYDVSKNQDSPTVLNKRQKPLLSKKVGIICLQFWKQTIQKLRTFLFKPATIRANISMRLK